MKTIYVGHSRGFDYEKELYEPIRQIVIDLDIRIILPHEVGVVEGSTKELFQSGCDLFIAEVSYPATGLGIELGYADMLHIPIVCLSKRGAKISGSLRRITERFVEYGDVEELKEKIYSEIQALHG